jgi:acyl carrier protein
MPHSRRRLFSLVFIVVWTIGCADHSKHLGPVPQPAVTTTNEFTPNSIRARVIEIVAEQVGISIESIHPETRFTTDLKLDDLDRVEIAMECEEAFEITIPDSEVEQMQTVNDLILLVTKASTGPRGRTPEGLPIRPPTNLR